MTLDDWIVELDRGLRSITGVSHMSRPVPEPPEALEAPDAGALAATASPDGAGTDPETSTAAAVADESAVGAAAGGDPQALTPAERALSAGLMRVNHVGEVCAQALYQAQKLTARSPALKAAFERAGREEEDHLAWTARRLEELDSRPSVLNPLWYAGALAIGFAAGRLGDRVSLGFMAETERQVEAHLDSHLERLPAGDRASRAIVEQMRTDEIAHAQAALDAGGIELPFPVRALMRAASKVMTRTAYYL